ncbi:MAG: hypothetical protein IKL65_06385 [Bacilli bacterium]|nr:hypothetical protein [Bacilli bacterium]
MNINDYNLDENEIMGSSKTFLKKYNNIYISEEQIQILKKYDIDINKYVNLNELIYDIEECLNDSYDVLDDLEWVSQSLSEYNYYNNTNK